MCKEGEIIFFLVKNWWVTTAGACQEAITALILLLSLGFISTGTSQISQTYCLLHLRHLFTFYSLYWLWSLFVTGSKDIVEKADSLLWILPNLFSVESDLHHTTSARIYVWHVWKLSWVWKSFFKKNKQKAGRKKAHWAVETTQVKQAEGWGMWFNWGCI